LYCSFDPEIYFPEPQPFAWDLGYMGTYSDDRQPTVDALLLDAARSAPEMKFAVVGPQYPDTIQWPKNVERINHLSPREHRQFYNAQRFTLNVTRRDMIEAGYSPSVRLFEAAACGTPIISDFWPGLDEFFRIDEEILIATSSKDTLRFLLMPEGERKQIGEQVRSRVLTEHTAAHRAAELDGYLRELLRKEASPQRLESVL
jgi:spore maturation protein CgeB